MSSLDDPHQGAGLAAAPGTRRSRLLLVGTRFAGKHWLALLGLVSLVAVVVAVNPMELGSTLENAEHLPLALMAPAAVLSYVARALAWRVALREIGVRIGVGRSVTVMIAGQALIFLPTGDLGRVAMIHRTGADGRSPGEVTATVAFVELTFMTVVGLALVPAMVVQPSLAPVALGLVGLLSAVLAVICWAPAYRAAVNLAVRVPGLRRFEDDLRLLRPAFVRLMRPRVLLRIAAWEAVSALLAFLLFELGLRAIGVTHVSYANAAFIYSLGHILSAVSMLPGGLGAYEGILTGFMALQGVHASQGAAAALLYRGFNDAFMALLGVVAGVWLRRHWGPGRPLPAPPA